MVCTTSSQCCYSRPKCSSTPLVVHFDDTVQALDFQYSGGGEGGAQLYKFNLSITGSDVDASWVSTCGSTSDVYAIDGQGGGGGVLCCTPPCLVLNAKITAQAVSIQGQAVALFDYLVGTVPLKIETQNTCKSNCCFDEPDQSVTVTFKLSCAAAYNSDGNFVGLDGTGVVGITDITLSYKKCLTPGKACGANMLNITDLQLTTKLQSDSSITTPNTAGSTTTSGNTGTFGPGNYPTAS